MKKQYKEIQRFKRLRTEYKQIASKNYNYLSKDTEIRVREIESIFKFNKVKL